MLVVERLRHLIAERGDELAATVRHPQRTSAAETVSSELLPLADACRFLERRAPALLAPRRAGRRGRPLWLGGTRLELRREPLGLILVIGPSNYPLLLPGVQALQALAAGNAVLLKPGRGGAPAAEALAGLLAEAGLDDGLLAVLDESEEAAREAIDCGVDKVLLTGSAETGGAVLARLAPKLTPAAMELSGCDAVFVRGDADLDLAARCLRFGLTFNGGATCIAPRRVFVSRDVAAALERRLRPLVSDLPPVRLDLDAARRLGLLVREALAGGARIAVGSEPRGASVAPLVLADARPEMELLRADVMAPVLSLVVVDDDDNAVELAARCPYALGATVFGDENAARRLAARVRAGVVVINDMIVPTADPRLPFGGRGRSGFGLTRGSEGLLELTAVKSVVVRRGSRRPHLEPLVGGEEELLLGLLGALHASSIRKRLAAAGKMVRAALALGGRRGKRPRKE